MNTLLGTPFKVLSFIGQLVYLLSEKGVAYPKTGWGIVGAASTAYLFRDQLLALL